MFQLKLFFISGHKSFNGHVMKPTDMISLGDDRNALSQFSGMFPTYGKQTIEPIMEVPEGCKLLVCSGKEVREINVDVKGKLTFVCAGQLRRLQTGKKSSVKLRGAKDFASHLNQNTPVILVWENTPNADDRV